MSDKILVFGAGATGRGHIGLLAWQAGFKMVFVDFDRNLVKALKDATQYKVKLYGKSSKEITVTPFKVYNSTQREEIAAEIVDSALVLTAVFDQNLSDVAKTVALAIAKCRQVGRNKPLNFLACENMQDSSSSLGRHVREILTDEEFDYCRNNIGFPDCMISRVVPRPEPDPLVIIAEDYNEWTVRAQDFKGHKPKSLTALELVENQTAYLERKFFIHNGAHAVCGYFGFHRGYRYVHEAVADNVVAEHVLGALDEIGQIVYHKHSCFTKESIKEYEQDLCRRGAIVEMKDQILRVVRQPIRKLSENERLVAPAKLAVEYGLPRKWIVKGIVAALKYDHCDDEQSVELAQMLKTKSLAVVLNEVCGIEESSLLSKEIQEAWEKWSL